MKILVIGLSITSSWGNGHATTFRSLLKSFAKRGHSILFLERDVSYYAQNRDLPQADFCEIKLYKNTTDLKTRFSENIKNADAVMVGSYVYEGVLINELVFSLAKGVKMFYDIDTPVTLNKIANEDFQYIKPQQIKEFDIYLSFSGGPILDFIMEEYKAPSAKALYCSVDTDLYFPKERKKTWKMGYLGTYSADRQLTVEELLNKPAKLKKELSFLVAGPQYPENYDWAENVERISHLPPQKHNDFYNSQQYTLNVTRENMIKAGFSPSVRLFEAAACATPVISDYWSGLESFFEIGTEILIAENSADVLTHWKNISEKQSMEIGQKAREKILKKHTSSVRAKELEEYINTVFSTPQKI